MFNPGERVIVKNSGTRATVLDPKTALDPWVLSAIIANNASNLVLLQPDTNPTPSGRCFVEPGWIERLGS